MLGFFDGDEIYTDTYVMIPRLWTTQLEILNHANPTTHECYKPRKNKQCLKCVLFRACTKHSIMIPTQQFVYTTPAH